MDILPPSSSSHYILHIYFKQVKILPLPWKDLIRQVKTEEGGWEGWTSPAFWCGFLPLFTLFYIATPLTAETFPTSVALSACQSEQSRGRGSDGRSSRGSSSSRPGGRSFRRHLRVGSRESGSTEGWDPLQQALAEVLKRLHLVRPGLPSPLLLAIQPTSKVLTQEDKGSNCWEVWRPEQRIWHHYSSWGFFRWGSILREFVNQRTLTLQFRLCWQFEPQRVSCTQYYETGTTLEPSVIDRGLDFKLVL